MKLAIISVTNAGAQLSEKIAQNFNNVDIFAKSGRSLLEYGNEYESLSTLIAEIFDQYDAFVFIMATGIVVRVIAPFIQDKRIDPAVIVADESGNYVISLLSGHIGGANDLARFIAASINAAPVITTATDVGNKPAVDVLAVKLGLKFELFENVKKINAAIVNGDNVEFFLDYTLPESHCYVRTATELGIALYDQMILPQASNYCALVLITDKELTVDSLHIFLRPPTLAVGIGCRRGTTKEEIVAAILTACKMIGRSANSIAVIGSTVLKQDEQGLLDAVQALDVPIEFYDNEQIAITIEKNKLDVSSFVNEKIGVGNVCEAAALLASQNTKILLPKTKFNRVTVAIAQARSLS